MANKAITFIISLFILDEVAEDYFASLNYRVPLHL